MIGSKNISRSVRTPLPNHSYLSSGEEGYRPGQMDGRARVVVANGIPSKAVSITVN